MFARLRFDFILAAGISCRCKLGHSGHTAIGFESVRMTKVESFKVMDIASHKDHCANLYWRLSVRKGQRSHWRYCPQWRGKTEGAKVPRLSITANMVLRESSARMVGKYGCQPP